MDTGGYMLGMDQAGTIAGELGDLPLALHLAGSFLATYRHAVTPEHYLAQLRDKTLLAHSSLQGRGADWSPTGHEQHVAKTFALGYERLDAEDDLDALALKLLGRAACFAPGEAIPRALLLLTMPSPVSATTGLPGTETPTPAWVCCNARRGAFPTTGTNASASQA